MPRNGSLTFVELAFERLLVVCPMCDRKGDYFVDTLIATHGREFRVADFLDEVTEDCPKRENAGVCGASFPQLIGLPQRRHDD